MMVSRRKLTMLAVLGFAAWLVVAAAARADVVVARDASGRPIRFDVRDAGIDVEWFAAILRGADPAPPAATTATPPEG